MTYLVNTENNIKLDSFRPIRNRILIKKDEVKDADSYLTQSGILVLNADKPRSRLVTGRIIKMGTRYYPNGSDKVPVKIDFLAEGDHVLYYFPAGVNSKITIEGVEYELVRVEDIDCVIPDKED